MEISNDTNIFENKNNNDEVLSPISHLFIIYTHTLLLNNLLSFRIVELHFSNMLNKRKHLKIMFITFLDQLLGIIWHIFILISPKITDATFDNQLTSFFPPRCNFTASKIKIIND